ncbi:hypothetical protein AB0O91_13580 [Kitasatospora sp. NPDC089797]|uniref:DUF6896 domain-containing protein n=1 Tax=Kitasatospora sp. NPDC089797 TaxID=3155298 RepID=UPI00341DBF15
MSTADQPRWILREAVALWGARLAPAAVVVDAAVEALGAGLDGPALGELAALERGEAEDGLPGLLDAVCAEVGLPWPVLGSRAADAAGVRALARQVISGRLAPRRFAELLHGAFGHRPELIEPFDGIHDDYRTEGGELAEARLDVEVLVEAWRLGADRALVPRRRPVTTARALVLDYLADLDGILADLGRHRPSAGSLLEWVGLARSGRIPRTGVVGGRLYQVHGAGCRFTGPDGVEVDVDATGSAEVTFDAWRLQCHGASLPDPFAASQEELRAAASALPQLTDGGWPGRFVVLTTGGTGRVG